VTARELARAQGQASLARRRAEAIEIADEHIAWLRARRLDAWEPLREMLVAWSLARGPPANVCTFLEGGL